ncbi:glycosyltransferase family 4 protein [Flavisolibacter tropicus]|nr:glycosyltransferase family 1 protein [Flavisolibacter tropicus]
MHMNRIVFDCERMKYPNTGLYSYCLNLGTRLQQTLHQNAQLTFFIPPAVKKIFGSQSSNIIQHSYQKFWLPSLKDYHIWHATYQGSQYLPQLNKKIKVVLTIHDLNFMHDPRKSEAKKKKYLKVLQHNIDRSAAIICISEFAKSDVLQYCATKNKPIYVIHNGTNSLEKPGLFGNSYKPRTRFLFSIGVMERKKNFHVLLPLLQQNKDMELLIAGQPNDREYIDYIISMARELGVEEKLKVLGAISEEEKSWYYENCYAFTFPSLSEGFGLPVTEAMSVGKPLFLSDKTALPEIGQDIAFYFNDFNSAHMQKVFIDGMQQYKTEKMQDAIKLRGQDFCWQKAAQQYINVYQSL